MPAGDVRMTTALWFTEDMVGFAAVGATDPVAGAASAKAAGSTCAFRLTIRTDDVDACVGDPTHPAGATGYVDMPALGGKRPVQKGWFSLFVDGDQSAERFMLYRLWFTAGDGRPMTFIGKKIVFSGGKLDVWQDTTTLFVRIFAGHVDAAGEAKAEIVAAGVIIIRPADFARQMTTIRTSGGSLVDRAAGAAKFTQLFLGSLWEVYGFQRLPALALEKTFPREIPLYTLEGVRDVKHEHIAFETGDGLGLSFERFTRKEADDVVVVIHGLTTSTDMFIMPEHRNLVSHLLDNGYGDVWCLDFRMSNRHDYNLHRHRWSMDDIALYDFPAAFAALRARVGARRIHVVCHCLGSVSFLMSLFGGAVDGVTSVVANSVGLTPRIPLWSRMKIAVAPFVVDYVIQQPYLNPRWAETPGITVGKIASKVVGLFHGECDVPACHMLSLMWGAGKPALYRHENLHEVTHRRGGDLYGATSMHYYRHVRKMVGAANTAVKYDPHDARFASLPDNYLDRAAQMKTPVLCMTGRENKVFSDSNIVMHKRLESLAPGRHGLAIVDGYGHQDVFMGKHNDRDVFPLITSWFDKARGK